MKQSFTLGIVLGALATSAWAQSAELFRAGAYNDYAPDAENGKLIFNAGGCATCHAVEGDDTILAGGQKIETRFGDLYTPNISHHQAAGIGKWSNSDFLNALLRGVSPDGNTYFGAVFPYPSYSRMKPEDALDLKAYMATLPTSDAPSREHDTSIVSDFILQWMSEPRGPLETVSDEQRSRGQYLVEAVGHCAECHTPRSGSYKIDEDRRYEGEFGMLGEFAPSITGDRLKNYGAEAFVVGSLGNAKKLNGSPMTSTSMRRMARLTSQLTIADRAAMYAYLTGESVDLATLPSDAPEEATEVAVIADTPDSDAVDTSTDEAVIADKGTDTGGGDGSNVKISTAEVVPDKTGARKLMQRVDAYCEAQEPIKAVVAPATETEAPKPVAAAEPAKRGIDIELVNAADQLIEEFCRTCHAPGKSFSSVFPTGDIADMKFDQRILIPGDPDKSPIYTSIATGGMPKGMKMNADQLDVLRRWIVALGDADKPVATPAPADDTAATPTPAAPAPVAAAPRADVPAPLYAGFALNERMLAVVTDINDVDERDRRFMRYFSFAQMPLAEIDCNDPGALKNPIHYMHAGFNKLLNSVSNGSRVTPVTPVEGTEGAIVRIDLRDFGWDETDWLALSTGVFTDKAADAGFEREVWEDLAAVYPYAVDPDSDPMFKIVADATGAFVPMMRADWVARFASEAPYYDTLLDLTAQISDLEERIGLDVDREIQSRRVIRAGMLPGSSGVSDHNRMLERFELPRAGYYWKSYDFAGDHGEQSLELHPDGPPDLAHTVSGTPSFQHDGGEMIFSLRNGLQGYYLSDAEGNRLLVGPASIVSFRTKPIGKGVEIVNGRSCFDCHDNGMIAKKDEIRPALMSSQRFSRDQLEVLLEMYADNDTLSDVYAQDREAFLTALKDLNATTVTAGGQLTSLRAPVSVGGGEIVTYLADMHFHALDLEQLARDFHLDVETFRMRARQLGDPQLTVTVGDWISRLDAGGKIHRSEVELHYGDILERISSMRPFRPSVDVAEVKKEAADFQPGEIEEKATEAVEKAVKEEEAPFEPATKEPVKDKPESKEPKADRLTLAIHVAKTDVHVNDLLEFTIKANKKCELQMFYVEESKNIEELPQAILGPNFLEPGEVRTIPFQGSGLQIRFDEPGTGETMLAFCRVGGLADKGMSAEGALEFAKSHFQPLTRGIAIEAATKVQEDDGQSATNHVTFNVLK